MARVLVAGIGNVFLGDDGFGVQVARRLRRAPPEGADIADFGIRGIRLAHELASGKYSAAILVYAVARGGPAGRLYAMEAEPPGENAVEALDAHGLTPAAVLWWLRRIGGGCRVIVVGCEPESVEEMMALSPAVAASVDGGVNLVREIAARLTGAETLA